MTETEAVRAVQAGDATGLTFLVTAYEVKAMRVAFAITGDRLRAEDVVAEFVATTIWRYRVMQT